MPTEEAAAPRDTQEDESLSFTGLYAISTMLNHPWKKAAPIHASSARFPPIGPASGHALPQMPPTDMHILDEYVSEFSDEWNRYEREHALIRAHNATPSALPKHLPPLSTVPQVFFSSDFDLGQPYTFDLVTERYKQSTAMGLEGDADVLQYGVVMNHMLQEKLSYYSDVIEQHLIVEIGAKSASFFDALATLHQLRTDAQSCLERTHSVSRKLHAVDAYVRDGLEIARLQAERRDLEAQQDLLTQVQKLLERRDLVRLSVQHDEFENAVTLLEDLYRVLDDASLPLYQLECLKGIRPQLEAEQSKMSECLQADLTGILERALWADDMDVGCVQATSALNSVLSPPEQMNIALPAELLPVWSLLERCGGLPAALQSYTQRIDDLLIRGVRRLIEPHDFAVRAAPGSETPPGTWPEYMRALAAVLRALWLYAQCMQSVHDALNREVGRNVLTDATQAIWSACERVTADVISLTRAPPLSQLGRDAFIVYFALVWRSMQQIEAASSQPSVSLRSRVLSQAKTYLSQFHRVRVERAVRSIEDEVWTPVPVSPELQHTVQQLVEIASNDVPTYCVPLTLDGVAPHDAVVESEQQRQLLVGSDSYFVVRASGQVIELLSDYARVIVNMPMFAVEALGWVVEFLKQFNSRTCQVVLGAGAMRSAGLKNITARHLAIAAQSLSLMMALVPSLRELLKRHLKTTQFVLLSDFDKLQNDFREHQYEIHAKLVSIMGDRVQVHSKALANTDVNKCDGHLQPIQDLVRETGTLFRVVTQFLQPAVVQTISTRVFTDIDMRMSHAITAVDVRTLDAHKLLITDVELLNEKMHAIDASWRGDKVTEAAKAKRPRLSIDARREGTPTLAYKARKSLGKRPPATQSPQIETNEAFQAPPESRPGEKGQDEEAKQEKTPQTSAPDSKAPKEPATNEPAANEAQESVPSTEAENAAEGKAEDKVLSPPVPATPSGPTSNADERVDAPLLPSQVVAGNAPLENATPTKPKDTTLTPTPRKGRVSLEQRLAEAAKRRCAQRIQTQQAKDMPSPPSTPLSSKPSLAERLAEATKQDTKDSDESSSRTKQALKETGDLNHENTDELHDIEEPKAEASSANKEPSQEKESSHAGQKEIEQHDNTQDSSTRKQSTEVKQCNDQEVGAVKELRDHQKKSSVEEPSPTEETRTDEKPTTFGETVEAKEPSDAKQPSISEESSHAVEPIKVGAFSESKGPSNVTSKTSEEQSKDQKPRNDVERSLAGNLDNAKGLSDILGLDRGSGEAKPDHANGPSETKELFDTKEATNQSHSDESGEPGSTSDTNQLKESESTLEHSLEPKANASSESTKTSEPTDTTVRSDRVDSSQTTPTDLAAESAKKPSTIASS